MVKLVPQIIFSIVMLIFGIAVVFYTGEIRTWVLNKIRYKGDPPKLMEPQTIWSMRFGGGIAILIGLFILWMSWRYYHGNI